MCFRSLPSCCYWIFLTFTLDCFQWFRVYRHSCLIHIKNVAQFSFQAIVFNGLFQQIKVCTNDIRVWQYSSLKRERRNCSEGKIGVSFGKAFPPPIGNGFFCSSTWKNTFNNSQYLTSCLGVTYWSTMTNKLNKLFLFLTSKYHENLLTAPGRMWQPFPRFCSSFSALSVWKNGQNRILLKHSYVYCQWSINYMSGHVDDLPTLN